jgi:hypothetical protein
VEIMTSSGVRILVRNGETGKLLSFDQPVATIELTYEEARRLAYAFAKEKQAKLSKGINQLLEDGYFRDPRSFSEIRERLLADGLRAKSASLHTLVTNLVERGILARNGSRRSFTYGERLQDQVT